MSAMQAEVKWTTKGRAVLGLFVPGLAWLSWYAFTSRTQPSPAVGWLAAVGAVGAVCVQGHLAVYRLRADASGMRERFLWGTRFVGWDDVQKVESIAQQKQGRTVYRWSSTPEEAWHIIVHTRKGRVGVHRWMTGVDDFIAVLRTTQGTSTYREVGARPIDREDPSVKPVHQPSALGATLNQVHEGLIFVKVVLFVIPLTWAGGMMAAVGLRVRITDNLLVDGTLLALVPWGLGFGVYKLVERARAERFGAAYARPPLGAQDAILTMAAAMFGPVLVYWFAPRAVASQKPADLLLAVMGVFFCWLPVAEVRKQLRDR
jgi:hypothetical protein